ncbi:GGDEF domain-containing protein [Cyanobium sp. Morenito 9A2]|nr:GGDEF domain-containing protein [Cyanobium sp. Morenito 9A2]
MQTRGVFLFCHRPGHRHVQKVNERHGHAAGDEVLKHFVTTAQSILRKGDCMGRIDGEEFEIMLLNTSKESADSFATRLHQSITQSAVAYGHASIRYSASMGLVCLSPRA